MNSINIIGRLTKEPELKTTANGNKVVSFCLAVDRRDKAKTTDWIDCVAWNKTAEILAQYCHKGKLISVSGSLQTRTYDSNGHQVKVSEVLVNSMDMLSKDEAPHQQPAPAPLPPDEAINEPSGLLTDDDDLSSVDLPFEV